MEAVQFDYLVCCIHVDKNFLGLANQFYMVSDVTYQRGSR